MEWISTESMFLSYNFHSTNQSNKNLVFHILRLTDYLYLFDFCTITWNRIMVTSRRDKSTFLQLAAI